MEISSKGFGFNFILTSLGSFSQSAFFIFFCHMIYHTHSPLPQIHVKLNYLESHMAMQFIKPEFHPSPWLTHTWKRWHHLSRECVTWEGWEGSWNAARTLYEFICDYWSLLFSTWYLTHILHCLKTMWYWTNRNLRCSLFSLNFSHLLDLHISIYLGNVWLEKDERAADI